MLNSSPSLLPLVLPAALPVGLSGQGYGQRVPSLFLPTTNCQPPTATPPTPCPGTTLSVGDRGTIVVLSWYNRGTIVVLA